MNINRTLTSIALLFAMATGPAFAQQNDAELKQRILAQAQSISPDDYAFTRTTRSEARWNNKTIDKVTVEKFDPTKPADARWTLVSVNGAPPSATELRKYRKKATNRSVVPGYHRIANYFGAPATVSREDGDKTVFRFATVPKGSVSIQGKDLSRLASAEAAVVEADGAPVVEQVRFTLKPPRQMRLIGVDRYETTFRYRIGADGKPLLAATESDLFGSGLALDATMHTSTTYSNYRAVRNPPGR